MKFWVLTAVLMKIPVHLDISHADWRGGIRVLGDPLSRYYKRSWIVLKIET
jgi:hypothetical protein